MTDATDTSQVDLAPFSARKARIVGQLLGLLVVLACVAIAVLMPLASTGDLQLGDRIAIALSGVLMGWFCWRQATVTAVVTPQGVVVRNLIFTRRVAWSKIRKVRMIEGEAWARLELVDGDEVAVMAIQRADGEAAYDEARRLRRLHEYFDPR